MAPSLLWVVSGLLLLIGSTLATVTTTDGTLGEPCGPHRCLWQRANCDAGPPQQCVCNPLFYTSGDGRINCYKNNTVYTEVYNDPLVKTYNNIKVQLPLPCRYLLTHTITYLKNKKRKRVGFCHMKTHAFHQKYKGKFYVSGYDMAIMIKYDNGTYKNISLRMYGLAANGVYKFYVNATNGEYLPNGDWGNDPVNCKDPSIGLKIEFNYQEEDNLAILFIRKCGIRVQFRGYDAGLRLAQPYIPHFAYGINCAFHPKFPNADKVVAIPPAADHGGKTIDDLPPFGFSRREKIFLRALSSGATQNSPQPNPECDVVKDKLDNCPNDAALHEAFDRCMFILESPRFIRCYDDTYSGTKIMELFGLCVDLYCNGGSCATVKGKITADDCHIKESYPAIDNFLASPTCFV